jgi:hypothetical protein
MVATGSWEREWFLGSLIGFRASSRLAILKYRADIR